MNPPAQPWRNEEHAPRAGGNAVHESGAGGKPHEAAQRKCLAFIIGLHGAGGKTISERGG
ncbi:MAG: hypothetical protein ACLUE0_01095 [Bacteroides uniformis]